MMTLDEVINELEYWDETDAYPECFYDDEVVTDALHYLKAFRDAKDALDAEREKTIEAYCQWKDAKEKLEAQTSQMMWVDKHFQFEISDNLPLTWDELKTMEGKPIWMDGSWYLVYDTTLADYEHDPRIELVMNSVARTFLIYKKHYGERWLAYRKERS